MTSVVGFENCIFINRERRLVSIYKNGHFRRTVFELLNSGLGKSNGHVERVVRVIRMSRTLWAHVTGFMEHELAGLTIVMPVITVIVLIVFVCRSASKA